MYPTQARPLSNFEKRRITKLLTAYAVKRILKNIQHQLTISFDIKGTAFTLFERRPASRRPGEWTTTSIARFRREPSGKPWTLYWRDRNSRWHISPPVKSSRSIEALLQAVDRDETGIFYG